MGHRGELRSLSSNSGIRGDIYDCGDVAGPNLGSSLRYYTLPYGEASSSSSSSSAHEQDLENDRMIAQLLSEELPPANDDIGKRLTHLSSIPLHPRVNSSIPTVSDSTSDHQRLLERLHLYGLRELKMIGDGNCQFRALAHQLYQTPEFHKFVRKQVIHQLKMRRDLYEGYVPMKYADYLKKMNRSGEWGDHVTLQAAADHFGVKIYLVTSFRETCFIEITPKQAKSKRDLFLSFWSEIHYNSIYAGGVIAGASDVKRKKKHWLF